jgi:hypothetical protein
LHTVAEGIGSADIMHINPEEIAPVVGDVVFDGNSQITLGVGFYLNTSVFAGGAAMFPTDRRKFNVLFGEVGIDLT